MQISEYRSKSPLRIVITFIFSIIFLILQLILYYFLFFGINFLKDDYYIVYRTIYLIVEWLGIIVVFIMYGRPMNQSFKLSWTIFILLCPFLGTMCYLMFGNGRVVPKRRIKKMEKYTEAFKAESNSIITDSLDKDVALISKALHNDSHFSLYKGANLKFYPDILDKHKQMLKDFKEAKKFIFMEYFIFGKGEIMKDLIDIFQIKSDQGVEIRIIYDDIGSFKSQDKKNLTALEKIKNVHIVNYDPIGLSINPRVNYRDHRKVVVVDGNIAYTGGDNIADEYIHTKVKYGYWFDNAIRVEGEVVKSFTTMFIQMYYMASKEKLDFNKYLPTIKIENETYCFPFVDGPNFTTNPGYHLFLNLINSAKESIYISSPYFIIDSQMINALVNKARQGIDVRILIPGIPDKKLTYSMTKSHMGVMLKNGVKVYKYTPGFNHAKNIVIDNKYSYIGSLNMDYRSMFMSFEDGIFIYNDLAVNDMYNNLLEAFSKSERINYKEYKSKNIFLKLIDFALQVISPLF